MSINLAISGRCEPFNLMFFRLPVVKLVNVFNAYVERSPVKGIIHLSGEYLTSITYDSHNLQRDGIRQLFL